MSATFTYKIDGVRTATVGNLTDVVKQVNFTITGEEEGLSFSLPSQVKLEDPDPNNFVQFSNLTEQEVIAWVAGRTDIVGPMKDHIQMVLNRMVQEAQLQSKPLPWAPVTPPEPAPTNI